MNLFYEKNVFNMRPSIISIFDGCKIARPINRASTHGTKVEGNSKITNVRETRVV